MFAEIRQKYLKSPLPLPFVVTTAGEMPHQHDVDRPRGLSSHQVLLVAEGAGRFTVHEEEFALSAGEGLFFRRDVPHQYWAEGKSFRTFWVTFLGAEEVLDYYGIGDAFTFKFSPSLLASLRELCQFCDGNSTVLTRSAAGYSWVIDWLQEHFAPTAPFTVQVRRFLEVHFAEALTLDQIASAVYMNRYALCHHYKEACGITVMEQLRQIRIAKAKQLLQISTASIEEIGRSCGFESHSYFTKTFRQELGCTPREYRKKRLR